MLATAVVFGARPGGIGASSASWLPKQMGVSAVALVARTERSVRESARRLRAEQPELLTLARTADLTDAKAPHAVLQTLGEARLPDGTSYLDGLRAVVFAAGTVVNDRGSPDDLRAMHAMKGENARRLIEPLAEAMAARSDGTIRSIVLVGSLAALMPVPSLAEYCASNQKLLELAESLSPLRSRGVRCTYCAPGYVKSDLLWQQIQQGIPNPLARMSTWYAADPAERVAEEIFQAVRAGERVVVPGANAKALYRQFRLARSVGAEPFFRLAQDLAARWSGY